MSTLIVLIIFGQLQAPFELAEPVVKDGFVRPAEGNRAKPIWGVKNGIRLGIWPTAGGPRGLLRVIAPYLKHKKERSLNLIAFEPKVAGERGLSELEQSPLDKTRGLRMWTSNDLIDDPEPKLPWEPASGKIIKIGKARALTFYVYIERFKNGAQPIIQVILREDKPREIGLRVFASRTSQKMTSCILSSTMGNYARLRHLWLANEIVDARKVWDPSKIHPNGFFARYEWRLNRLHRTGRDIIVAATPDETEPEKATYSESVPQWWRYQGTVATQYWRKPDPHKQLVVRVNARQSYWGHPKGTIPGGTSYENFELEEPFRTGQTFWFGVTTDPPETLSFSEKLRGNITGGK